MKGYNQTTEIKKHLLSGKTITSVEAFELYGVTRLSAKIYELRNKGMHIETIKGTTLTRYGDYCEYAIYKYIPDEV